MSGTSAETSDAVRMERVARHSRAVDGRREAHRHLVDVHARDGREVGAHEPVERHGLQLVHDGLLQPELRRELACDARCLVALHELDRRAALDDRAMK